MLPKFSHIRPETLKEVLAILDDNGARIHGGGTDLIGCLRDRVFATDAVVSLSGIPELRGITPMSDGGLRLGAMTTITEIAEQRCRPQSVRRPRRRRQGRRQPATAKPGHHRRQPMPETAVLVLPRRLRLSAQGRRNLLRLRRREPAPLHLRRRHVLHRPPIGHRSGPWPRSAPCAGFRGPPRADRWRWRGLHVPPSVDPQRETVLETTRSSPISSSRRRRPAFGRPTARSAIAPRGTSPSPVWPWRWSSTATPSPRRESFSRAPRPSRGGLKGVESVITGTKLDAATIAKAAEATVAGAEPLAKNGYKIELFKGLMTEQLEAIRS